MHNQRAPVLQLRIVKGEDSPARADFRDNLADSGVRYKVDETPKSPEIHQGRLIDSQGQAVLPGLENSMSSAAVAIIDETRQALLPGFNNRYEYNEHQNYSPAAAAFAKFANRVLTETTNISVVNEVPINVVPSAIPESKLTLDPGNNRLTLENLDYPQEDLGDAELDAFLRSAPDRQTALLVDEKLRLTDYLDELSLQEAEQNEMKRRYDSTAQYRGSRLKNLGRALLGAAKSVVTALPRAIDALLPDTLQATPKIEILEGLKRQKAYDLEKLRLDYQRDLKQINSAYDSIAQYVKYNYGDSIPRFNTTDRLMLSDFVVECKFDENSVHYQAVKTMVEYRLACRTEKYNQDLEALEANHSARENIDEMLNDSRLLRVRENIIKAVSSPAKPAAPKPNLRKLSINSINSTATVGSGDGKGGGSGNEPPVPPQKRKFWRTASALAAGAAALGLGILVGPNKYLNSGNEAPVPSDTAANTDSGENPTTETVNHNDKKRDEEFTLQESQNPPVEDLKTPVVQEPVRQVVPAPQPEKVNRTPVVQHSRPQRINPAPAPRLLKTARVRTPEIVRPPQEVISRPTVEDKSTQVLTLTEKFAELRLVEAKVSAYKRRLSEIEADAKILAPQIAKRNIDLRLDTVLPKLDSVIAQMKTMEKVADLEKINEMLRAIDTTMAEAETTVKLVNVAEAMVPQGHAQKLLQETQKLAGSQAARFSIIHNGHSGSNPSVNQYSVNLSEIQSKLTKIQQSLQNHEGMTLHQSRLARLDAEYWVGYLKFVNWYLQYNPGQVVPSK